jgi:SAM-dependent methyltransferase
MSTATVVDRVAPAFDYAAYPQVPILQCPVCAQPNPSIPARDRYGYQVGTSVCRCGFAYLNPQLSADGYTAFYNHAYRPLVQAVGNGRCSMGGQKRGQWIGHNVAITQRTVPYPLKAACDVGGSHGAVTEGICAVWPVTTMTVIDPHAAELALAAARGFATICAPIEAYPAVPTQDLIVCTQTMDHLRDPLGVLRWLRSITVPGGWAYLDVVDARLWAIGRHTASYDWKLDHPGYWSAPSFDQAVKLAGWRLRARMRYGYHYAVVCEKEKAYGSDSARASDGV